MITWCDRFLEQKITLIITSKNKIEAINSFIIGVGGGASALAIVEMLKIQGFEPIVGLSIAAMVLIIIVVISYKIHRNHR